MGNKKKKILFVAPLYKDRSPSQRFRFEQYLEFLENNNFQVSFSNLITPKTDKVFYSSGNTIIKVLLFVKFVFKRAIDLIKLKKYEIIFVQREAFFTGITFFERKFSKKSNLIFDFDDSIWLPNVSNANKKFEWLKNYDKTKTIISYAKTVIAGNKYLADYARQFNNNVKIIPTTINTDYHINKQKNKDKDRICIGWTGTSTTVQHFELTVSVLEKIKNKYRDLVYFKLIGEENYTNQKLNLKGTKWCLETEIDDLSEINIGIMPLPDDEWAKGKCGLKGLQYMALEIPTIMSPVGVNTEIIKDGVNGFLAKTEQEWFNKLSLLIESEALRMQLGKAGRQTVVEKYSVEANKQKYLEVLHAALK